MTKVYIAGPMRGIAEFNFPAFDSAAHQLETIGFEVFSPADHDREGGFTTKGMTGNEDLSRIGFDLRDALKWDLEKVMESDLVVVLPGYQKSTGAAAEIALAEALGTPWCALDAAMYIVPWASDAIKAFNTKTPLAVFKQQRIDEFLKNLKSNKSNKINQAPNPGYASGGIVQGQLIPQEVVDRWSKAGLEKLKDLAMDAKIVSITVDPKLVSDKFVKGTEVRSVSSTGGEKGTKDARFDLIPADALHQLAEHYGFGARKYADNQWRKGYEYSKSYAAMQRHLNAWWGGEDTDEETGSSHVAAAAWHCFTLLTFLKEFPEFDDRYKA